MKIIFNTGVFGKNGIEHALVNLLLELDQTHHQFILHQIYELDEDSPLLDKIKHMVVKDCSLPRTSFWGHTHMHRKKSIFYKLLDAFGILNIHRLIANHINQQQADMVVDYDLSLLRSAHLITAPKIGFFHFRPKRFRNGGVKRLRRIGKRLKHYQTLVVLCDEMYQEACDVWPHLKDKLIVLPNAINMGSLIKKSQETIHLPPGINSGSYFISIVRLTHQKNIELLLAAYQRAKNLGCSWPLLVIGDGEYKEKLMQLSIGLNIEESVFFLGYQTNPHPYLAKAGTLVMSSREEGFPVSLLEALALGCPIISLACPTGPTDILQHGVLGRLIPFTEDNPAELGLAMFEMSENSLLRNAYTQKYATAVENYAADVIALRFMDILRNTAFAQGSE